MTIAILQALLAAGGCYGLWRLWRVLANHGRASLLIAAGFLLRAIGSLILFWVSWLRLPVARSLQLGDGLWFFALDGQWYLGYARELLQRGPKAIVFINSNYASRIFTQWLTVFAGAFGAIASTGILLNCFCYLAACALIVRIAARDERPRDFALAAIAFGPSVILWSLQPLKDTFFVFLIVAMVAVWSEWQKLWRGEVLRRRLSIAVCALAMWYAVYAIAGTRWYVGALLAALSLPFLGVVANLPRPRLVGSVIAVILFVALAQAFFAGGSLDVPLPLRAALESRTTFHAQAPAERAKLVLANARRGFETTPGGTMIAPGRALQAAADVPEDPKPIVAPAPAPVVQAAPPQAAPPQAAPPPAAPPPAAPPPAAPPQEAPPPAAPQQEALPQAAPPQIAPPQVAPPQEAPPQAAPPQEALPQAAPPQAAPPPAAPPQAAPPKAVHPKAPPPQATPAPPPPVQERRKGHRRPKLTVVPPETSVSLAEKITVGAAAMFLPRAVAQAAGLVRIGGGRGFWLFADLDTLVFDFVVLFALAFCVRSIIRRERRVTPLFVLVLLLFVGLTGPMTYAVTNFGTLFRLREMVYVLAAMLPLTLDSRTREREPVEER